jgi:hypothetical protein
MKRITADAELRRKLMYFTTPLEFCDETGRVIARLTPSTPWNDPDNWSDMVEITPPVSDEEMQRRLNSNEPTYTTQELIARIKEQKGE